MLHFLQFCFIGALIDRNVLSEFEDFEAGVVEHHTQLQQPGHARHGTESRVDSVQSLQSLTDSFEELQQRYKQLKDDGERKLKVSTCLHTCSVGCIGHKE